MALNLQGTPNTRDYVLGRGALYLAKIDAATGQPLGYRHLGNAPSFTLNLTVEEIKHKASLTSASAVDKRVVTSQEIGFSFELDEATNFDNLALFFQGTVENITNPAVAGVGAVGDKQDLTYAGGAELGRWYDLIDEDVPASRGIWGDQTKITIYNETTMMAAVLGTDYTVDVKTGRVFILSTATGIDAADVLTWYSAADATAPATIQKVKALKDDARNYALKFVEINASNDSSVAEIQLHSVSISADGDFGLISDEFSKMQFKGLAQVNSLLDATLTISSAPAA